MAEKPEYHALVLSSIPETLDEVTAIANEHFEDPTVIYWEMGNTATKAAVLEQIEATPYNVIISYINGIILKRRHLDQAVFGRSISIPLRPSTAVPSASGASRSSAATCEPITA